MKLTIEVTMDNAAFVEDEIGEFVRIMRDLTDRAERDGLPIMDGLGWAIMDANGNRVGILQIDV